ncbi:hypothetical protein BKA64DRAFT_640640 [Cadophora sp. MPI-SDFR-AT-0126]|nr:hypothetical protein BKA64DRAFT_640640 [Leotiomycetes sp. MPI-SDFR-AT-0126]
MIKLPDTGHILNLKKEAAILRLAAHFSSLLPIKKVIVNRYIITYHRSQARHKSTMSKRNESPASDDPSISKPNKKPKSSPSPPLVNDISTPKSRSTSTAPSSTIVVDLPKKVNAQASSTPTGKKRGRPSKDRSSLPSTSTPKQKDGARTPKSKTPKSNVTTPNPWQDQGLKYVVYKRICVQRTSPYYESKFVETFTNLTDANNKVARLWKEEHSTGFVDYVKDKEDDRICWASFDRDSNDLVKVDIEICGLRGL